MQDRSPPTHRIFLLRHGRTIHLGQKRTLANIMSMSALPPKADIVQSDCHVRFVPKADVNQLIDRLAVYLLHEPAVTHHDRLTGQRVRSEGS